MSMDWFEEEKKKLRRIERVCIYIFIKGRMPLTCGVDEGRVELLGEQRVGHVPEELLQQSGHVVNAGLLVQLDGDAAVELVAQLQPGQKEERREEEGDSETYSTHSNAQ